MHSGGLFWSDNRVSVGTERATRLTVAGDAPPILFSGGKRECAVHGGREKRFGAKRHGVPYLLKYGGPSKRLRGKLSVEALGAGPVLLTFSVMRPRRSAPVRRGCKTDLTCFYPPLPLCQSRRGLSQFSTPAALSEAGSAEREEQSIRRPPRKKHPRPQMRGSTLTVPTDPSAPGRRPSIYRGTVSLDPRFAHT